MIDKESGSIEKVCQDSKKNLLNNAYAGYVIAACRIAGLDRKKIEEVIQELERISNTMSVEEAEKIYIDFGNI